MKKLRYPKLFLDTETTGLNANESDVIQVFACVPNVGASININMRPRDDAVIESGALQCNGLTKKELFEREVTQEQGAIQLAQFIKEHVGGRANVVAYNSGFDKNFVQAWFERVGIGFRKSFHFRWLCGMQAVMMLADRGVIKKPRDYKLATVAAHLGIQFNPDDLHEASTDVVLTIKIFAKINAILTPIKIQQDK